MPTIPRAPRDNAILAVELDALILTVEKNAEAVDKMRDEITDRLDHMRDWQNRAIGFMTACTLISGIGLSVLGLVLK